ARRLNAVLVGVYPVFLSLSTMRLAPVFFVMIPAPPRPTLFPYTTLFRSRPEQPETPLAKRQVGARGGVWRGAGVGERRHTRRARSEEHTSELQSRFDLVCRLLLEKKKNVTDRILALGRKGLCNI